MTKKATKKVSRKALATVEKPETRTAYELCFVAWAFQIPRMIVMAPDVEAAISKARSMRPDLAATKIMWIVECKVVV